VQKSAKQALSCWLASYVLIIGLLFIFLGKPASSGGAAEAMGRAIVHTGFATLVTWLIARKAASPWSWLRFFGTYALVFVVVALVMALGNARSSERKFPFVATFPSGWNVERLQGVSSHPEDATSGVRERAMWGGADGLAVIEIACSWKVDSNSPDLSTDISRLVESVKSTFQAKGMVVDASKIHQTTVGGKPAFEVTLEAKANGEIEFRQKVVLLQTPKCVVSAVLGGTVQAFDQNAPTFDSVLEHTQFE